MSKNNTPNGNNKGQQREGGPSCVNMYIGLKGSPLIDEMLDAKTRFLTKLQNERDLAAIKWTLKTLKERMDAFAALQNHDIVADSLRQLVSGQVCQVAINIRSFCNQVISQYGKVSGSHQPAGALVSSDGSSAHHFTLQPSLPPLTVLQKVQEFVQVQAKSLFKLEHSLCYQTEPKCPIELLRTQFFLKVEIQVTKGIRQALRPMLQDRRAKQIDASFREVKKQIAEALQANDRANESFSLANLLGINVELVGSPDSFRAAVAKLVRCRKMASCSL